MSLVVIVRVIIRSDMIIWYWSVKGGVGTSVMAAATAIRLSSQRQDTILVDLMGDQPVLLGLNDTGGLVPGPGIGDWVAAGSNVAADAIGRLLEDVTPHFRLLRRGASSPPLDEPHRLMLGLEMLAKNGMVVVDAGMDVGVLRSSLAAEHNSVCILRSCYLALARAQRISGPYDHVILVEEPGRALRSQDVAAAVGSTQIERVPWDPRVSRAVDAGTIVSTLPPPLRRFELPV